MSCNVLEFRGVAHRYPRSARPVVEGIDFTVGAGEILALVGRSGCGKSTLLHLAAGLHAPSAGEVWAHGERVKGPSPRRVLMFQQPSLYPWATVAENAALALRFAGRSREAATRVPAVLATLHLEEFADRNVQDLSGGQQQRVALARSLVAEPELLLLDEPFSALDVVTRAALQDEVRGLAKRLGVAVVLVTHDLDEAARVADRALVMTTGRIRAEVPLADRRPETARAELLRHIEAAAGLVGGAGI